MLIQEFEERTGFYPTIELYKEIEKRYSAENIDKDEFCRRYKNNVDGIAESIRRAVDLQTVKNEDADRKKAAKTKEEIDGLKTQIEWLKEQLEKAQGWTPVEVSHMTQKEYNTLRTDSATTLLEAREAAEWIEKEFGFPKDIIVVYKEIPTYQKDRYGHIRQAGKVSRPPVYNATDWNYVRFDVKGWQYEIVSGSMHKYYD